MALTPGAKLGPYEILALLGAGGMGEVYRARDTKLGRAVALKVLPEALARDPQRMARFEREAQLLASLNHPNIASIYGLEDSGQTRALVMELVEGPTLAELLETRKSKTETRISTLEVLPIAKQIAEGLEAAHERGIVHRDLKPANVKIAPDGTVKILDFGLAKALDPLTPSPSPASGRGWPPGPGEGGGAIRESPLQDSPTLSAMATQAGVILGTAPYMSPEQAKGKIVDRRGDIWAFGCVLYEMLSGKQAFEGETVSDVLAAVIRAEPEWGALPVDVPPAIHKLLARTLMKDSKQRLQAIGEARIAIEEVLARAPSPPAPLPQGEGGPEGRVRVAWRRALPWALAGLLAIAVVVLSFGFFKRVPKPGPLLRSEINLPPGFTLNRGADAPLALSPDGSRLALAAVGPDHKSQLWLRSMDNLALQPLVGTEGATYPFWSPDGRYVGFFALQKLKKIEISSGIVQTICDATGGRGASWSRAGMIAFTPEPRTGLFEVPASGGTPTPLTTVDRKNFFHRLPHFLPDGKRLLFYSGSLPGAKENGIYSLDLGTKKFELVAQGDSEGIYVEPGYLVFVRDQNLMVQPFDAKHLRTAGQAVPVAERVVFIPTRFTGQYSLSETGLLVFRSGGLIAESQLTWFDLDGRQLGTVGDPADFFNASISPDGKRAITSIQDSEGHFDLWMYDLDHGIASRFTSGAQGYIGPLWSPDGRQVAFTTGAGNLSLKVSDGSGEAQSLSSAPTISYASGWSPDGRMLAFSTQTSQGWDLWILPMVGDRKPYPFIVSPATKGQGSFSPDGHWFAYISEESGRPELFVAPFPGPGGKRQISSDGATAPQWLARGRQLAYKNAEGKLVEVEVNAKGQAFEIGKSQLLFGGRPLPLPPWLAARPTSAPAPAYFTPDGKRILWPVPLEDSTSIPLTLVTNWPAQLKK